MSEPSSFSVFTELSHEQLLACQIEVFKQAQNTRADVLLLQSHGAHAVLKDYSHSSKGFSMLFAPFLVSREIKALSALGHIKGIPLLIKRVSKKAFLMEYLPAQRIRAVQENLDWKEFIGATERLVKQMHDHGVIHGDLRNATNIMVDHNNSPVFIDFVSAVHRGHKRNPFSALLFRLCLKIDQGAMYKLKSKYAPELINQHDHRLFSQKSRFERTMRWISVNGRNVIQKLFP